MIDVANLLADVVGQSHTFAGGTINDDYTHDEALTAVPMMPLAVVCPGSTAEVADILAIADAHRIPVTARGSGTGLSGAATPVDGGIVVSFERMNRILEIDADNGVAVVQPGVTLDRLDAVLRDRGLVYPVYPGEYTASVGGNVATNAGGMRAVKYGVTRHHVLGLEAVLAGGEVVRTGGKFVKATSGYDLTQLLVGSEGTLALVTEIMIRVYPRQAHTATILAPFRTLDDVTQAVPRIVASGIGPLILEYIDFVTMAATTAHAGLDLGIPDDVKQSALAYLVVMLEDMHDDRLEADTEQLATSLGDMGAIDVYVLPSNSAEALIQARENAFWVAKANNADDIVDVVVPRAAIPQFMAKVVDLAAAGQTLVVGCGHAGDGNVHLSVFQKDDAKRHEVMQGLYEIGLALGGAISAEHGIGTEKKRYLQKLENPVKIDLMRGIKAVFDPNGILNPGKIFD